MRESASFALGNAIRKPLGQARSWHNALARSAPYGEVNFRCCVSNSCFSKNHDRACEKLRSQPFLHPGSYNTQDLGFSLMRPVLCQWDAELGILRVLPRYRKIANEQFADGLEYPVEVREQRSSKQHQFYFASIRAAHDHLSDANKEILKTPEHLRKWGLICSGWYDETLIFGGPGDLGKQAAMATAGFARRLDDYAEIKVVNMDETWFARIRTAKSQSLASMNKDDFKQSSRDVLDILAGAIEVGRRDLEQAGRTHG